MAVSPTGLLLIIAAAVGLAVVWALVVIAGYRVLAPDVDDGGSSTSSAASLVVLLALGVAAPAFEAAHLASVQRNLITGLFGNDVQSATVPDSAAANPWGNKDRVNVLLLGGDGGADRTGVRTDTVIVASIDTHTGATTTFSLPRNLEDLPFPRGQPAARRLPRRLRGRAPRARACSTPSTGTARATTPTSSARPTTRAPTSSSSASARPWA